MDTEFSLDSILSFGKYKGYQIEDVIEDDPKYISWLIENTQHTFDEEAMQLLQKRGII